MLNIYSESILGDTKASHLTGRYTLSFSRKGLFDKLADGPDMIRNTQLYLGHDAQSFIHTVEIIVRDVRRQGGGVVRAVL